MSGSGEFNQSQSQSPPPTPNRHDALGVQPGRPQSIDRVDDLDSVSTFRRDENRNMGGRQESFMLRGRDSFYHAGRMSMDFAHQVTGAAGTAVRGSVRSVRLTVGPLGKSYFANWTKGELILALVKDDYQISHQNMASTAALREVAKEHFEALGRFPPKPTLASAARHREMDEAALVIQKRWIKFYFLRQDEEVLRADVGGGYLDSDDDMEFDWELSRYSEGVGCDDDTVDDKEIAIALFQEEVGPMGAGLQLTGGDGQDLTTSLTADSPSLVRNPTPRKATHRSAIPPSLDINRPWVKPSVDKALANAEKYHPRLGHKGDLFRYDWLETTTGRHCMLGGPGEQCDLWREGTVSQFSKYGPGITNYFKFVKWCFWVFVALSILQSVPIAFNTFGEEEITDGTSVDFIFRTTAGNLGDSNRTYSINLPGCGSGVYHEADCSISKGDVAIFYSTVSALAALIVLVAFVWLRIYELREVILLDKNTVSASDFTVTVSNLPQTVKVSDIKRHFTKLTNFNVVDVRIAEDNEEDIMLFFRRGELFRQRKNIVELYRYTKSLGKAKKKFYDRLEKDIKKVTEQIKKIESILAKHLSKQMQKNKESVPLLAYVTFEESIATQRVLQIYHDTWLSYWFMDADKRIGGMRPHLERSPQPSIIIWENLGYSTKQRFQRRLLTWVLSIALLIVSAIATFSSRALEQRAQNEGGEAECPVGYDDWTKDEQIAYSEENPGTEHCYCSNLSLSEQSNDYFCRSYYQSQAIAGSFTYLGAFVVVVINGAIDFILKKCAVFEKHHSIDDLELSVFVRMFILKFINSGALFLLSNTPFILTTIFGYRYHQSVDFTPEWFATVGVNIMLVQLGDILFPHAWKAYRYFSFHSAQKRYEKNPSLALNQRELNELYLGPDFLLSTRYAQLMSNFYICLIFSTGMPILCVIAVANFYFSYWVDKYLFTNFYRTPPYYNSKIGRKATSLIPYAVLVFLGVAVWTLGNREIFRSKNNDSYSSYYRNYEAGDVSQKITQSHVLPLFIFFVVVSALIVLGILLHQFAGGLHIIFNGLCGRYLSKYEMYFELQQYVQSNINMSYRRAIKRHIIKGLNTYKMFENPKYQAGFHLTKKFTKTHSNVSSIRFLESSGSEVLGEQKQKKRISDAKKTVDSAARKSQSKDKKKKNARPSPNISTDTSAIKTPPAKSKNKNTRQSEKVHRPADRAPSKKRESIITKKP